MLGLSSKVQVNLANRFDPRNTASNLAVWLKYNTGLTVTNGKWVDYSGKNNSLTGVTEFEPSVDSGGWLFNPGEEAPDIATLQSAVTVSSQEGFMAFFVLEHDALDTRTLLGTGSTAEFIEIMNAKKLRVKIDGTTVTPTFATNQFVNDTKYILTIKRDAGSTGNIHLYINGVLSTPSSQVANAGAIACNVIGARGDIEDPTNMDRMFDGHIYEMLIYEGATELTTKEITNIHHYLKDKHGI